MPHILAAVAAGASVALSGCQGVLMEKIRVSAISFLLVAMLASPAMALSRYECKGLASQTIVLSACAYLKSILTGVYWLILIFL